MNACSLGHNVPPRGGCDGINETHHQLHLVRKYTQTVYNTKGTRAHTHKDLIREWLWKPKGSSTKISIHTHTCIHMKMNVYALGHDVPPRCGRDVVHKTHHQLHLVRKVYTNGSYTKGTRAHTHRELIREWLWEPKGSSLDYI